MTIQGTTTHEHREHPRKPADAPRSRPGITLATEDRFRAMFKESADAIQLVTPEGEVLYSSDSVERVIGYTPEEIQGVVVTPYLHPEDLPSFQEQWVKLLEQPKNTLTLEYRVKHKNGSWVYVETTLTNHLDTPEINAIMGNFRNITKRKLAEESLRSQTVLLKTLTENATLGLIMMDARQYCTFLNPAAEKIIGYTMQEIQALDKPLHDIIHHTKPDGSFYPIHECPIDHALPTEKQTQGEDIFVHPDGSFYPVAFTASPIVNNGIPTGTVIEVRDTTKEKADQQEYERLVSIESQRNELIALNKAKDDFIALASHQLRTPATAVKQYTGILLEGMLGELTDAQLRVLRKAYDSNEREIAIVNDLLKVAQLDAGKVHVVKAPTDLTALASDVIDSFANRARDKQITITLNSPADSLMASVDEPLFRMVLENLIDNALKYSPSLTTVTVQIGNTDTNHRISIIDQGVGIPKEARNHLFKKFSRISNDLSIQAGGSGLGLYWVKEVVSQHGGKVTVASNKPAGTIFNLWLPQDA